MLPDRFRLYPTPDRSLNLLEKALIASRLIYCPVCGKWSRYTLWSSHLREGLNCGNCDAWGRKRQIAYVLLALASRRAGGGVRLRHLSELSKINGITIYNTESQGGIHEALAGNVGYTCSEYFGDDYKSGQVVNGVLNEDLRHLSFPDQSLDVVISSDVLEHVPEPYDAHQEIYRVLKPDGFHIFTVPFHYGLYKDQVRARIREGGEIEYLLPPEMHGDALRQDGILCYTTFSLEMLVRLSEIGFVTEMYRPHVAYMGIIGADALVFVATRT